MLARLRHPVAHRVVDAATLLRADPTGTFDIRRRNRSLLDVRWRKFIAALKGVVMEQDILGLKPERTTVLGLALAGMGGDAKTRALQTWVDATLLRVVLEGQADYLDPMIAQSYQRGLKRAQRLSLPRVPPTMNDVISNLQQLTLTELQGICEAVSQRLVRLAAHAQLEKAKPQALFTEMRQGVESIGMVRSRALVEVMVVKTHAMATLDTFEQAGVKRVAQVPETVRRARIGDARRQPAPTRRGTSRSTVARISKEEQRIERLFRNEEVEVETAGDDLVCPECEELAADGPYDIDTARSLIPAHPNCRCAFTPADEVGLPE